MRVGGHRGEHHQATSRGLQEQAVGKAIRRLRAEKGLSQEVLSGLAGIARTHLTMIEQGDMLPNLRTLWRLADALGLRPSQLIEEIEKELGDGI